MSPLLATFPLIRNGDLLAGPHRARFAHCSPPWVWPRVPGPDWYPPADRRGGAATRRDPAETA
jgi:hypothetical protein